MSDMSMNLISASLEVILSFFLYKIGPFEEFFRFLERKKIICLFHTFTKKSHDNLSFASTVRLITKLALILLIL